MNKKFNVATIVFLAVLGLALLGGNWETASAQGTVPECPPVVQVIEEDWENEVAPVEETIVVEIDNECCGCERGEIFDICLVDLLVIISAIVLGTMIVILLTSIL